ncbi:hypothetical protein ACFQ3N_16280 [Virgibacillus byunsanensis]|uniref:ATPase n=1 Tax=Virgibacillus byunsanensis TaxID=570945 RepID=A0ABW3LNG2_9BACI
MSSKTYYVTGNTAHGFINFLETNLADIEKIIILKHNSNTIKTKVIQTIADYYSKNETVEILHSALSIEYLDGIILRDKSVAFLVNEVEEDIEAAATINLAELLQIPNIPVNEEKQSHLDSLMKKAYNNFAIGLKVHDDLEKVYIQHMDFDRANELADRFITGIIDGITPKANSGHVYHRLFGTNTSDGIVNVVPKLINDIANVYYIKGRAGTGKSTFMKKIAAACEEHGLNVEMYHCSFDPNSIDMVIVPELEFCIFDSTDPHEFFPDRDGEVVVDLYKELVERGTDEKYVNEITELNRSYKSYMKKGIEFLKIAGEHVNNMEKAYKHVSINKKIDEVAAAMYNKI